jgi:CopG family nickel-responsive transcriptional regulator
MLRRFGVSLEDDLLAGFDKLIVSRGYANRSEAIRDLIRDSLVRRDWETGGGEAAGAVVLVYDHHRRELQSRLTELQHGAHRRIVATMHAHLDHDNCIELVLLRGKASDLRAIGDQLIATRGVKHGRMVFTTLGKRLT